MTEPFTITPENRDRYIEETREFCDNVALKFVRQANLLRLRDDLLSVARLKLVEIFAQMAENQKTLQNTTHLFAKLRISLRRRLIDASEEFRLIRTPRTRGTKPKIPHPAVFHYLTDKNLHGIQVGSRRRGINPACDSTANLEFRKESSLIKVQRKTTRQDLMDRCVDGIDRSILVQALDGRTRKEIANDLQLPQRIVRERCGRLLKAGPT